MTLVELYLKYGPGVRVKFHHYPEFVISGYFQPEQLQDPLGMYRLGAFEIQYDGDRERNVGWLVVPDDENENSERVG